MSNNDISKYFVLEEGSVPLASDSAFQSMSSGTVITNINSGESYSKVSGGMCPVFNRVYIDNSVLYVSQRLTDAQKAQARENIGIGSALDDVLRYSKQNLTNAQKAQARENIGVNNVSDAVRYTEQSLTSAQKAQARENIGALATSDLPVGSKKQKGILQVGSGINVSSGVISVDDNYIKELVGSTTPEIQEAVYSSVSVFGIGTKTQKSVVGTSYAGSKLYKTTSITGESDSEDYKMTLSEPLSGTWKCVTSSSVSCTSESSGTSGTTYTFHVQRGSFMKV